MRQILALLVMAMFLGPTALMAQDNECEAGDCPKANTSDEYVSLETLIAAQEADRQTLKDILQEYQDKYLADPRKLRLDARINIRAGMIRREQTLADQGLINEKKLKKKEKKK